MNWCFCFVFVLLAFKFYVFTYLGFEREFANASVLVVVPHHDFVRRIARIAASAHKSQQIAAEQHLYDANASIGEYCKVGGVCVV